MTLEDARTFWTLLRFNLADQRAGIRWAARCIGFPVYLRIALSRTPWKFAMQLPNLPGVKAEDRID